MCNFKAAIFDMDGTLLDSYTAWEHAFCVTLKEYGISVSKEEFIAVYKMTDEETQNFVAEKVRASNVPISVAEMNDIIYKTVADAYENTVEPKPGAIAFVESLHKQGIRLCLATLTPSYLGKKALTRLGLMEYLEFIITGDDVGKSKEFPDIYLEACGRLGHAPQETAVFEDSLTAAKTASKAGFLVYGVYDKNQSYAFSEILPYVHKTVEDWLTFSCDSETT